MDPEQNERLTKVIQSKLDVQKRKSEAAAKKKAEEDAAAAAKNDCKKVWEERAQKEISAAVKQVNDLLKSLDTEFVECPRDAAIPFVGSLELMYRSRLPGAISNDYRAIILDLNASAVLKVIFRRGNASAVKPGINSIEASSESYVSLLTDFIEANG